MADRACGSAWNSCIAFYQSYGAVIIMLGKDVVEKSMTERWWLKQLRPLKPALKCSLIQKDTHSLSLLFLPALSNISADAAREPKSCFNQCLQRYCVIQTLEINRKREKQPLSFPSQEHNTYWCACTFCTPTILMTADSNLVTSTDLSVNVRLQNAVILKCNIKII